MPALLSVDPVGAKIWYNGVTFTPAALTEEFRATPVWDAAGRTIIHTVFSITIKDYIVGRPSDRDVEARLSALLQPAAGFVYNGRGLGNVRINLGQVTDMVWGPKPQMVSVKPLGGSNAVELTWQIQFATLNCGDARYTGPMEFVFKLTYDVDRSGYTKRIYSGHIRIAQTRWNQPDRQLHDSADAYREQINPPLLPGFRRTPGQFVLSEDKCRLDFTITDEELPPNIPPPGVVDATVSHDYGTSKVLGGAWSASFEGEYEIARGYPVSVAYQAAARLIKSRLDELRHITPRPSVIPTSARIGEPNIYGKTMVRIGLTYTVVAAPLAKMIAFGGLWKPVPGSNWRLWAISLSRILGPRGIAQLAFNVGDDAIVDLCGKTPTVSGGTKRGAELRTGPIGLPAELRAVFPPVTPSTSYLRYSQSLRVEDDHGNVIVKVLPTKPIEEKNKSSGAWDVELSTGLPTGFEKTPFPPANDVQYVGGGKLDTDAAGAESHQRVSPTLYVYLVGSALRAGYPVPVPQLEQINGTEPTIANREGMGEGFQQAIVGNGAGVVPIYGAKWCLRYCLTDVPRGPIPVPPNALLAAL
jgi:hypothetical protein